MNWQIAQVIILTGTCIATSVTAIWTGIRAVVSWREYNMNLMISRHTYPQLFDKDIHGMPITNGTSIAVEITKE